MTIFDVAARAGVSTATVSRVLSGARPGSMATAERVRRAAKDLGYTGNTIASALRRSRTDTIGMVVPSIANPFFTALVESTEHALQQHGKNLFLCDSRSDHKLEAQRLDSLIRRQVDGIIISPCHGTHSEEAIRTAAANIPLVQLDRYVSGVQTDWVGVDDDAAMALVLDHLAEQGVRTASLISSTPTNSSTELRLAGFRKHAKRTRIATRKEWIALGSYSTEWGREATSGILESRHRPEAIVCADDLIALGALQACRDHQVDVPGHLLVTGFDDIPFASLCTPPLTTIAQPRQRIADEAVRLLDQAMNREQHSVAHIGLLPELIVRESTAKLS